MNLKCLKSYKLAAIIVNGGGGGGGGDGGGGGGDEYIGSDRYNFGHIEIFKKMVIEDRL